MWILKQEFRPTLQRPAGKVLDAKAASTLAVECKTDGGVVVAVGDQTAFTLCEFGCVPDLSVVDGNTMRKPVDATRYLNLLKNYQKTLSAKNPAGSITEEAQRIVVQAILELNEKPQARTLIEIVGEEDLLYLPVVLSAPEGALVLYGQPEQGIVAIKVTKQLKGTTQALFSAAFSKE